MSQASLTGKHIVLGVTAGIAAYKAPILVRSLRALGAEVEVILSANAHHFVGATALQAVSGKPVRDNLWDAEAEAAMGHIELARWADLVVIAPATANCLAALAHGQAGDLLTTVCLATEAPILVAPAMNQQMYLNQATQDNLATLEKRGFQFVGPDAGEQACGEVGPGRMSEPEAISKTIVDRLSVQVELTERVLSGQRVTITAGPTKEAIDPVRFISNHSSGKQGLSLAAAAFAAGADVLLIAGPGVAPTPPEIRRIDVVSARDMEQAAMANLTETDIFIGVAAVADYRPAQAAEQKIKRAGTEDASHKLELVENPDIIAGVAKSQQVPVVVGFAAETNDTLEHARAKLRRKGLNAIVLNDVSDPSIGFNSTHNAATLITTDKEVSFARQSKDDLAAALIPHIAQIFNNQLVNTPVKSVTK